MSGLNPFTRALLRIADWIAGENQSEWTAAMAAETDAAGAQGLGWALGCVGAAFIMRLRNDWKRIALLAVFPIAVNFTEHAVFIPAVFAWQADWFGAWALVPLSIITPLAMIFWTGWSSPGPFPYAFALYLLVMLKLWPLAMFYALTGSDLPLSSWIGANATHWMLPALFGIALSSSIFASALIAGYWAGRRRRRAA